MTNAGSGKRTPEPRGAIVEQHERGQHIYDLSYLAAIARGLAEAGAAVEAQAVAALSTTDPARAEKAQAVILRQLSEVKR